MSIWLRRAGHGIQWRAEAVWPGRKMSVLASDTKGSAYIGRTTNIVWGRRVVGSELRAADVGAASRFTSFGSMVIARRWVHAECDIK